VDRLNYHHLRYFWTVAKHGGVTQASKVLHLAHPTISGQIHRLEAVLGAKLFTRKGRGLVLTETGRVVFRYADEIFALGAELVDTVDGQASGPPVRLVVGVADVLARSLVHRMLAPAFQLADKVRVICRESRSPEGFLGELAVHAIDVVLSDTPAGPGTPIKLFNHPLGECGTSLLAAPALARACRKGFPRSLDGVPVLLPRADSTLRRALDEWFAARAIRPEVIAELDDAALASGLGEAGLGVFAAPDVCEAELRRRYRVERVGRLPGLRQRFYAISVERKLRHPGVVAICEVARTHVLAGA
jgi:LysR family transcriptional regulator, transcriptional activator of nhaA